MKRWLALFALLAVILGSVASASAAECAGVKYPETASVAGEKLVLNGMGLREATVFNVDVLVAALYVPKKSTDPKVLLDLKTPKRIILTFVRDVGRSDVVDAYRSNLKRAPGKIRDVIRPDYEKIMSQLSDMKKGQTQVFTYIPNKGLEIKVKGKVLHLITEPATIDYYLGLYMGPNPPIKSVRDGLVTGKCNG